MLFNSISAICYLTVFQLYCGMVMLFDVLGILKKWRERALKKSSCFISMTFITLIFFYFRNQFCTVRVPCQGMDRMETYKGSNYIVIIRLE